MSFARTCPARGCAADRLGHQTVKTEDYPENGMHSLDCSNKRQQRGCAMNTPAHMGSDMNSKDCNRAIEPALRA